MNGIVRSFNFILPTEIRYGEGVWASIAGEIRKRGIGSVLVVTDPGIVGLPFLKDIVEGLKHDGIGVRVFDRAEPNPKDYNVMEAAAEVRETGAAALIAVGGGSPIDCAKAVSVVAALGGKVRDYEDSGRITSPGLPLYTVPTTAGTGSEVTFSSVITDSADRFKFTVKSPKLSPLIAFVDPVLTHSMPAALTASTGLDALTHAVEAYTARVANPFSDAAALHAVGLINRHLITAVSQPHDREARDGMMTGSLLAGVAFSHSDVAAVHCIAEALGGMYDAPHGVCNAVALPVLMEYNLEYAVPRYARIARAMDISFDTEAEGARMAVEHVKDLVRSAGLPDFRSLGVREEDLREIAGKSARNGSNEDNPRPMDESDYLEVLGRLMKS